MHVVDIKTTDIGKNLVGAVVAPVPRGIAKDMTVGAWVPRVITLFGQLRLIEIVNEIDVAKCSSGVGN
jgi:hypothetical protein